VFRTTQADDPQSTATTRQSSNDRNDIRRQPAAGSSRFTRWFWQLEHPAESGIETAQESFQPDVRSSGTEQLDQVVRVT
jgi:hypothetical protein